MDTFHCISRVIYKHNFKTFDDGIYDALNRELITQLAKSLAFLIDDTFYCENSLQHIANTFDDNTDCVFGDLIYTDKKEKVKRVWKGSAFKKGAFKKGWMPAHPTFYCRRSVYEKNMMIVL